MHADEDSYPVIKLHFQKKRNQLFYFEASVNHMVAGNENKEIDSQFSQHMEGFHQKFIKTKGGIFKAPFPCAVEGNDKENGKNPQQFKIGIPLKVR